jgi:hypothetical protein
LNRTREGKFSNHTLRQEAEERYACLLLLGILPSIYSNISFLYFIYQHLKSSSHSFKGAGEGNIEQDGGLQAVTQALASLASPSSGKADSDVDPKTGDKPKTGDSFLSGPSMSLFCSDAMSVNSGDAKVMNRGNEVCKLCKFYFYADIILLVQPLYNSFMHFCTHREFY